MATLKTTIDSKDIEGAIRQETHHHLKRIVILVEGDDDVKIYTKLFSSKKFSVYTFSSGNIEVKEKVLYTFGGVKKVIGIIDSDFNHLVNTYPTREKIFYTDLHDIEMVMFNHNKTLRNIMIEHNIQGAIKEFRKTIYLGFIFLSVLKFYNEFNGLGLVLHEKLLNCANHDEIISKVELCNKSKNINFSEIDNIYQRVKPDKYPYYCNGHDVCKVIKKYIDNNIKSNSGISSKAIEMALRLSYKKKYFKQNTLYLNITEYFKQHIINS